MNSIPAEMLEPMLAMMPPEMAATLRAISSTIPELGELVATGQLTPEAAAVKLGEAMLPTFQVIAGGSADAPEAP